MAKSVKPKAAPKAKPKAKLPTPKDVPAKKTRLSKAVLAAERAHLAAYVPPEDGDARVLDRLWATIESRRVSGDAATSHSARLLKRGTAKVAQKLGEEAVELVIEAVAQNRDAIVGEAADVVYHLLVLLVDAGIPPAAVWGELERREGISGIVEKASRPKALMAAAQTTKIP